MYAHILYDKGLASADKAKPWSRFGHNLQGEEDKKALFINTLRRARGMAGSGT